MQECILVICNSMLTPFQVTTCIISSCMIQVVTCNGVSMLLCHGMFLWPSVPAATGFVRVSILCNKVEHLLECTECKPLKSL